jgi:TfoX/Sxy family transcriptional regulator of competence genes
MAFDEALADRVRDLLAARPAVTEQKMFGGICFMLGGNMAVGVTGEELLVRLEPEEVVRVATQPDVRHFEMRGRPTKGFVLVAPGATDGDAELARWVDAGADHAASLPPKAAKKG